MKFKKVSLFLLAFLVVYWIIAIFLIILFIGLSVSLIFYLKNGNVFHFDWIKESVYAIEKAVPGGGVLGAGIWIKAKIEENKRKKNASNQ